MNKRYIEVDSDGRPKIDDKSNGVEWITVADSSYYRDRITQPVIAETAADEEPIDLFIDDLP